MGDRRCRFADLRGPCARAAVLPPHAAAAPQDLGCCARQRCVGPGERGRPIALADAANNCCTTQTALLDPEDLTWTPIGTGKFDTNNEEGWTLLSNGKVLTVDAYVPINIPYEPTGTNSEIFAPDSGVWQSAGSTVSQLWDSWLLCGELSQEPKNGPTFEVGRGRARAALGRDCADSQQHCV
jgi:hypothetical protein